MRIIQVCDRPGWAIDKLSKPISEKYDNVDMSYFCIKEDRYLNSGYSNKSGNTQYTHELGNTYDIVHFHRLESAVINLGDLNPNVKRVLTIHTERHEDLEDPRIKMFDLIICSTKHAKDYCKEHLLEGANTKVIYIPHGIDLEKYKPIDDIFKTTPIGFIGRIVKWKRWDVIQKAAHTVGLKTVGCGYIENKQNYNIHNLSEGTDFEFFIFVKERDMTKFYSMMEVFICLSEPNIEVGPLPVMEAMSCGVPVISTKVGWAVDHCTHGENIWFVDEKDIGDLPKIIKEVYHNEELREKLKLNASKLIKNFSIEKYTDRIMNAYDRLGIKEGRENNNN